MKFFVHIRWFLVLTVLCSFVVQSHGQFYNGLNQTFGKNRLQHRGFFWSYYEFERYEIYFYSGGDKVAEYTARTALPKINRIEGMLGMKLNDKLRFVIYNKLSEYRQSNIGMSEDDGTTGGVTRISGNKAFLYFNGDYKDLSQQIDKGVAEIAVTRLVFGANWKEVVKNSTLLSMPDWYINGLVSYLSEPWGVEINNEVKDGFLSGAYDKINRLSDEQAASAGHAVWYYIAETYGVDVLPNILYMTRISRNIESGIRFVLGVSLKELMRDTERFYLENYTEDDEHQTLPPDSFEVDLKTRRNKEYYNLRPNPVNDQLAYVQNKSGKYKVYLFDPETGKREVLKKGGVKIDRIQDFDYPRIAWHPLGERLTVVYEEKGEAVVSQIDLDREEAVTRQLFKIDRVNSMGYSPDGKKLVLSAFSRGQTDIYEYTLVNGNFNQITNDLNDDLYPSYAGENQILFTSNRANDTLGKGPDQEFDLPSQWDVFLWTRGEDALRRVTNTPEQNEKFTGVIAPNTYTYLSEKNGVYNRYAARIDSAVSGIDTTIHWRYYTESHPVTNYKRSILEQVTYPSNSEFSEVIYYDRKHRFYNGRYETIPNAEEDIYQGTFGLGNQSVDVAEIDETATPRSFVFKSVPDTGREEREINIRDYTFSDELPPKEGTDELESIDEDSTQVRVADTVRSEDEEFKLPNKRNYKINFQATDIVSALDFDFANQLYQPFNGGPYRNPGFGTTVKVGMFDLFEDYHIEGGVRYSFNQGSTELFLSVEDRSKLIDKKFTIQRQHYRRTDDLVFQNKIIINNFKGEFSYPFSEVLSFRTTLNVRFDREIVGAVNANTLLEGDTYTPQVGTKFEFVYDNTQKLGVNLYKGGRFRVWFERYQRFSDLNSDLNVWGADFRYYQPIHRELILALRVAGSNSFGQEKLVYYMGDVDNRVILGDRDRFNDSIKISSNQNYHWQAIATNMRGFTQNIRNGNSFMVANAELRFPVVRYFANRPIKSDFAANLQFIGFTDVGTAWTGPSPFSDENEFNFEPITTGPITVVLRNTINPIVGSFGTGVRSMVFGYFVRVDYAWGVSDGLIRNPIFHISLSTDF